MRTRKTQLISLSAYCPKAKAWDKNDIIHRQVEIEDILNHPFVPMVIPKMEYPTMRLEGAGLYGFIKSVYSSLLP